MPSAELSGSKYHKTLKSIHPFLSLYSLLGSQGAGERGWSLSQLLQRRGRVQTNILFEINIEK